MPNVVIREDEWRRELERVMPRSDDKGMTARELGAVFGVSMRTIRERLRVLHDAGRIGVGKRHVLTLDGRPATAPVYWILPEAGRKKGAA
jgi:predicted ArsR family transcriptional regulator